MSTRDPNSPGRNPSPEADDKAEPSTPQGAKTTPGTADVGWIRGKWNQGERRQPENARIRRWMKLGDQALQSADEDPSSVPEDLDKSGE